MKHKDTYIQDVALSLAAAILFLFIIEILAGAGCASAPATQHLPAQVLPVQTYRP